MLKKLVGRIRRHPSSFYKSFNLPNVLDLSEQFPEVHFIIAATLYRHGEWEPCQPNSILTFQSVHLVLRHDFFVETSENFVPRGSPEDGDGQTEAVTDNRNLAALARKLGAIAGTPSVCLGSLECCDLSQLFRLADLSAKQRRAERREKPLKPAICRRIVRSATFDGDKSPAESGENRSASQ